MKKMLSFLFISIFLSGGVYADEIKLTARQFKNIASIDRDLRARYPLTYSGLNGSQEKMNFIGLSGDEVKTAIQALDFSAIEQRKKTVEIERRKIERKMVELAILEVEKTEPLTEKETVIKDILGEGS